MKSASRYKQFLSRRFSASDQNDINELTLQTLAAATPLGLILVVGAIVPMSDGIRKIGAVLAAVASITWLVFIFRIWRQEYLSHLKRNPEGEDNG